MHAGRNQILAEAMEYVADNLARGTYGGDKIWENAME
jgi:hypothetical protein